MMVTFDSRRLVLGLAISVLAHLFALYALVTLMRPAMDATHVAYPLQIRLMPVTKSVPPNKPIKQLRAAALSSAAIPTKTDEVIGVGFPAAVGGGWLAPTGTPVFGGGMPDQQALQARYRLEQQAQLIRLQLQQLLAIRFDVAPVQTGKCWLVESKENGKPGMTCDSQALHDLWSADEQAVSGMLLTLCGMGQGVNGFVVEQKAGRLEILLLNELSPRQ